MSRDNFVHWLQSRLTAHGLSVGPIDGILGPTTQNALRAFQTRRGLPVTGMATEDTVTALRSSSSTVSNAVKAAVGDRDTVATDGSSGTVLINNVWPRQKDMVSFFGAVGTNQTLIEIPYNMVLAWDLNARVRRMTVHKKVAASTTRCLQAIAETYSEKERTDLGLHLFGGSLNVRKMRGGSSYSMHSWGSALDFDPQRNQLSWGREKARLAKDDAIPFWEIWEKEGWLSLGRVRNMDYMHVQAARL